MRRIVIKNPALPAILIGSALAGLAIAYPSVAQRGYRPFVKDPRYEASGRQDPKPGQMLLPGGLRRDSGRPIVAIYAGECAPCAMSRLSAVDWERPDRQMALVMASPAMRPRLEAFHREHPGVAILPPPVGFPGWNAFFAPRLYLLSPQGRLLGAEGPYSTVVRALAGHYGHD